MCNPLDGNAWWYNLTGSPIYLKEDCDNLTQYCSGGNCVVCLRCSLGSCTCGSWPPSYSSQTSWFCTLIGQWVGSTQCTGWGLIEDCGDSNTCCISSGGCTASLSCASIECGWVSGPCGNQRWCGNCLSLKTCVANFCV
jgi:hypothetical protein